MLKTKHLIFIGFIFILMNACELQEYSISHKEKLGLIFSTDTVLFDTLLSTRSSITRRFRIYNPNENAVQIDEIKLGIGHGSPFNMIVNGKTGISIKDEVIFGGDSLMILIQANVQEQNKDLPYIVKDSIEIYWNSNNYNVKLIGWGQDAIYFGKEIICDLIFTADRPYVFYDTVLIDENCSLVIEAGAKIYFDKNAALFVLGNITAVGDSSNMILFRNSRFDADYIDAPGQWYGIYILEGSKNNMIDYVIIENAVSGIIVGSPDEDTIPDISINHSIIRNMSISGIQGFTSDIQATNTLIYNTGIHLLFNVAGGNYYYDHCTFSNAEGFFFQDDPSVQFADNLLLNDARTILENLNVRVRNSIIWGKNDQELLISTSDNTESLIVLENNIIRYNKEIENNFISLQLNFPGFKDPFLFNHQLDSPSIAINNGLQLGIFDDINGSKRDNLPDIGCYEYFDN